MFIDGRSVPEGHLVDTDICIIGTGPAGITLGLEFADLPFNVCLLESGDFEPRPEISELNKGPTTGRHGEALDCRERCFGGTSNHWTGWCRPLDAIDFDQRSWVPHSGWPFAKDHLEPYYSRAHEVLGIGPPRFDAEFWKHPEGAQPLPLSPDLVRTEVYQIEARRFGPVYRQRFERASNLSVYLHSSVVELHGRPDSTRVFDVTAKTLEGNSFRVRAPFFILAAGGIENPRLLLVSRSRTNVGLGNEHDIVGRCFMEHPHVNDIGFWVAAQSSIDLSYYRPWDEQEFRAVMGMLVLGREVAIRERRLGFSATLYSRPDEGVRNPLSPSVQRSAADVEDLDTSGLDGSDVREYRCYCRTEQTPNLNSRILLTDDRDALGLPRARLHWELTEQDVLNIREGLRILGRALGEAGVGRLRMPADDLDAGWVGDIAGGCHHMGTTRMSMDPAWGVVDANCKVHGVGNLYVAGSSVFPTCGSANPTLTIVALAVRLADHIKERMR